MGKQWKQWQTLFSWAPKSLPNGDWSPEIKRHLLLGTKAMTNLVSILKSRDITLLTQVCLVKDMFFFFSFIFVSWRLITLQYCSGFYHTWTWISHGFTCIPHPDPPSPLPLHLIPLGFYSGHTWMWELDYKESCALKYWCFWTMVLEKTLESPLDCKEIQPVNC